MADWLFGAVSLLLHFDGVNASTTFTDVKGHSFTAVGNSQISTAASKFGGSSGLFDGTGDYIYASATSSDFTFDTGGLTFEAWINPTSTSSVRGICGTGLSAGPFLRLNSGKLEWLQGTSQIVIGSTTIATGAWTHVAACRKSGVTTLYVNGQPDGSGNDASNFSTSDFYVGTHNGAYFFHGYIDEMRITKGSARYDGPFTPPSEAFEDQAAYEHPQYSRILTPRRSIQLPINHIGI
jgi:hypothetical protein